MRDKRDVMLLLRFQHTQTTIAHKYSDQERDRTASLGSRHTIQKDLTDF